jgi:N6-L-threonylcarbamoyladenine synthase
MKILAIETSCDETALAILNVKGGFKNPSITTMSHQVASQIALHTQYGGVFPMMAKREHARNIIPLFKKTLEQSFLDIKQINKEQKGDPKLNKKITEILAREPELLEQFIPFIYSIRKPKIDAIAVTVGPGLEPALWVGINFARALSFAWDIPVVPVNHMEGHILSFLVPEKKKESKGFKLSDFSFPILSLLVSGGHTELVLVKGWNKYKVVGQTRDDAVGEAFDKVARMLDLPYPGGPEISKLAEISRSDKSVVKDEKIKLPRPMIHSNDFDFSFSGLKTAVLYLIRDLRKIDDDTKKQIAREFEDASVDVLTSKTIKAMKKYSADTLIVGGGVSANMHLRRELESKIKSEKFQVYFPTKELSTDNAIMIGLVGTYKFLKTKKGVSYNSKHLVATGNLQF